MVAKQEQFAKQQNLPRINRKLKISKALYFFLVSNPKGLGAKEGIIGKVGVPNIQCRMGHKRQRWEKAGSSVPIEPEKEITSSQFESCI